MTSCLHKVKSAREGMELMKGGPSPVIQGPKLSEPLPSTSGFQRYPGVAIKPADEKRVEII